MNNFGIAAKTGGFTLIIPIRPLVTLGAAAAGCRIRAGGWAAGCLWMLIGSTVYAHHSSAPYYDHGRVVEVEGEITEVLWQNPHIRFTLRDDDSREWDIETTSVSVLSRWGLSAEVIEVGSRVRAAGSAGKRSDTALWVTNMLLPTGQEVLLSARPRWSDNTLGEDLRNAVTADRELGLFRVWTSAGRLWNNEYPLTEFARTARAAWDPVEDDPTANCAPKGMAFIMENPYPMEFVDHGEEIHLRIEEYDLVRRIHMSPEAAAQEPAASLLGHSVGRWEGDTLVVETTRIDYPHFDKTGIPQTGAVRNVERFSLNEDGSRLNYTVTVTDPAIFTEPVVMTKTWAYRPGETINPYQCQSWNAD